MENPKQTLAQLKKNLQESESYGRKLKESVQQISNEFMKTISEIAAEERSKITMNEQIDRVQVQTKSILEQNLRISYKVQKMSIKLKESERKKQIYLQMLRKTQQTNFILKQKAQRVSDQILKIKQEASQIEPTIEESNLEQGLQQKINSQSRVILIKSKKLTQLTRTVNDFEQSLWTQKKRNSIKKAQLDSLNQEIAVFNSQKLDGKQNQSGNINCQKDSKSAESRYGKLVNKSEKLDMEIMKFVEWITRAQVALSQINEIDSEYSRKTAKQSLEVLRQCRREKQQTMLTAKLVKCDVLNSKRS